MVFVFGLSKQEKYFLIVLIKQMIIFLFFMLMFGDHIKYQPGVAKDIFLPLSMIFHVPFEIFCCWKNLKFIKNYKFFVCILRSNSRNQSKSFVVTMTPILCALLH